MCGYTGRLYGDGSWKLMDMENVAAEGILSQVNPKEWNHLKLIVLGNSIFFFINGNFLTKYTPQCMINSGRVSLCSDYSWNMFRNIAVEPVRLQPLYVRRIDFFGDNILYNENWEIHAMESYMFYNRTSMEAKAGAEFSCTFEGTGISIIGTAKNAEFTVLIDGHTIYENFFVPSSLPRQACLILDQLPEGVHSNHGEFRLDVLEIPEPYSRMTDTLMIPKEVRAEMTEEQQQEQYRRRFVADTMDAEAMLWHMEHPFTQPPEPEETEFPAEQPAVPESEHSDAESTENPVTAESEATESAAETEAALSDSEPASVPEEPAAPTATEESTADADDSAGLPEV